MTRKVFDIIKANAALERLIAQQIEYPINVAYKIYCLKKNIDDIERYVYDRMALLFGADFGNKEMTEEQETIYNALMASDMEIQVNIPSKEELLSGDANLTVDDLSTILEFLESN